MLVTLAAALMLLALPASARFAASPALAAARVGPGDTATASAAASDSAVASTPAADSAASLADSTRQAASADSAADRPDTESRRSRHERAAYDDSVRAARAQRKPVWSEQPRWVMMRSLVIPGWGQAHNRAWFKATVVAGTELWLASVLISDQRELDRLSAEITAAGTGDPAQVESLVNEYNDRLNHFVSRQWLLGGAVAYALLDAYVDAHFRNFDIEFRNDPALPGGLAPAQRLDLRWNF
ncbi:MAG: hypothetical protein HYR73_09075 [Candidatus Eisenbacteria bacterium]|nr:hypothetical protein [Candidatus Eisenbacteria bacterium]